MANCYLVQEDGFQFGLEAGGGSLLLDDCRDITAAIALSGSGAGLTVSLKRAAAVIALAGAGTNDTVSVVARFANAQTYGRGYARVVSESSNLLVRVTLPAYLLTVNRAPRILRV